MFSRPTIALIVICVFATSLAGCLDSAGVPAGSDDQSGTSGSDLEPTGAGASGNEPGRKTPPNGSPGSGAGTDNGNNTSGNTTAGNNTVAANETATTWPPQAQATIRPGVQILVGNSICTSNFLFKHPQNETYYLGTAGHCVYNNLDAEVFLSSGVAGFVSAGERVGRVVYSSYHELGLPTPSATDPPLHPDDNDFALIQIDESALARTHPSMKYFGGPTGLLQDTGELKTITGGMPGSFLDHTGILAHGDTPNRPGPDEIDRLEGYLTSKSPPWIVYGHLYPYAFQGDSGGSVILDDGRALGIIVSIGSNSEVGITLLDAVMRYADDHGFPLELVTWEQFESGDLPI